MVRRTSGATYLAVYAAIFIFLLTFLCQFWAFEKRSEFVSVKARKKESYETLLNSEFTNRRFLQHLKASRKSENGRLEDELLTLRTRLADAARCLPKGTAKLELEAKQASCLRERLLGEGVSKFRENDTKASGQAENTKRAMEVMAEYLRESVQFLPLKDVHVPAMTEPDRTSFMSTLRGNGNPELFNFPSEESNGKVLCIKGRNIDGAVNSYGFAWPKYLPSNSTLLPGLTLVADNYWDYNNPWHSMTALLVAVSWQMENNCFSPERFVLFQNGGFVKTMGSWISNVLRISLNKDRQVEPDLLEKAESDPVCFEKAVVYRRGLGNMSSEKRLAMLDMIRCKARKFCNILESRNIINGIRTVNLTLVARTGARSFKNVSLVASVMAKACEKVAGCNFRVEHIANLSFCEQVEAMSNTDILATAHGAQLTNMMFMSRGSSVMEMFPKAWLEGAGVGQYTYHWFASWTGMYHEGTYRDCEGPPCPNADPVKCFSFFKDRQVGHNETFLAQWTADVLMKFQSRSSSQLQQKDLKPSSCCCE